MLKDKDGYDEGPVDLNLANRDTEIQFNNDPEPAARAPTSAMEEVVDKEIIDIKEKAAQQLLNKPKSGQGKREPDAIRKDTTNAGPMGLDPNAP